MEVVEFEGLGHAAGQFLETARLRAKIGNRLYSLNGAKCCFFFEMFSQGFNFNEYNISKFPLGKISNPGKGCFPIRPDPLMIFGVLKIFRYCHS